MAFTHDPTTDRGKTRLLISDTVEATAAFTDAEIDALLELNSDSIWYAAADGCRSIAAGKASSAFMVRIEGALQIDKREIPKYFLNLASKYEDRAGGSSDNVVEYIDSLNTDIDLIGRDLSEYVGDY